MKIKSSRTKNGLKAKEDRAAALEEEEARLSENAARKGTRKSAANGGGNIKGKRQRICINRESRNAEKPASEAKRGARVLGKAHQRTADG